MQSKMIYAQYSGYMISSNKLVNLGVRNISYPDYQMQISR